MTADLEPFRRSVVRVLSEDGTFFSGLGLRLPNGIVVTCAHVVGDALNYDSCCATCPSGVVRIHAPVLAADLGLARPDRAGWFPKRKSKRVDEPADIAILRLDKILGPLFEPPPISVGLTLSGISFWLLRASKGHTHSLVPIKGGVGEATAAGRHVLYWQRGYRIGPGCSGAPVCDNNTGQVIGMVVQYEEDPSPRVAFLIPPHELLIALARTGLPAARTAGPLDLLRRWVDHGVARHDRTLGRNLCQFIDAYSGTPEQPLPFVGRKNELGRLREWLELGGLFFVTGSRSWKISAVGAFSFLRACATARRDRPLRAD